MSPPQGTPSPAVGCCFSSMTLHVLLRRARSISLWVRGLDVSTPDTPNRPTSPKAGATLTAAAAAGLTLTHWSVLGACGITAIGLEVRPSS